MPLPFLLAAGAALIAATDALPQIVVTAPAPAPFAVDRVPDPELAAMRGGMHLPNGFDVAIGIDIQTRVDGILVLHTIYASDGPVVGTRVYTDGANAARYAPATVTVTSPLTSGAPVIVTDRSPTGTTVAPGSPSPAATVNLVNGIQATWLTAEGQTEVPVTQGGPAVTTGPGTFSLSSGDNGVISTLDTQGLQITHLIGQATGAVIANTANDRAIDTISSVNIDLQGASPALMGAIFTADRLAIEAVRAP